MNDQNYKNLLYKSEIFKMFKTEKQVNLNFDKIENVVQFFATQV